MKKSLFACLLCLAMLLSFAALPALAVEFNSPGEAYTAFLADHPEIADGEEIPQDLFSAWYAEQTKPTEAPVWKQSASEAEESAVEDPWASEPWALYANIGLEYSADYATPEELLEALWQQKIAAEEQSAFAITPEEDGKIGGFYTGDLPPDYEEQEAAWRASHPDAVNAPLNEEGANPEELANGAMLEAMEAEQSDGYDPEDMSTWPEPISLEPAPEGTPPDDSGYYTGEMDPWTNALNNYMISISPYNFDDPARYEDGDVDDAAAEEPVSEPVEAPAEETVTVRADAGAAYAAAPGTAAPEPIAAEPVIAAISGIDFACGKDLADLAWCAALELWSARRAGLLEWSQALLSVTEV